MSQFGIIGFKNFSRKHRGRKENQPCNYCRRRKVKCIVNANPPCIQCAKKGMECTFSEGSVYHKYTRDDSSTDQVNCKAGLETSIGDGAGANDLNDLDDNWFEEFFDNEISKEVMELIFANSDRIFSSNTQNTATKALDSTANSYIRYVSNGEYDPFLRYLYYQYNSENECVFQRKTFRNEGTSLKHPSIFGFTPTDYH